MSELKLKLPMRSTHVGYVHGQWNKVPERHPGVDLNYGAAQDDKGRLVLQPLRATVLHVDRQPYYGRTLVLGNEEHDLAFRYLHLDRILVAKGDTVEAEEFIARCGDDDGSDGPVRRYHKGMTAHLHHDVMRLSVLRKYGLTPMTWAKATQNPKLFAELFVAPETLYPALARLQATPRCWIPKTDRSGALISYLD